MRKLIVLLLCVVAAGAGAVSPETVVATVNGEKLTAGGVDSILAGVPPEMREKLQADPRQFVQQYALVSYLAHEGEENQLDEKEPYRGQLEWNQMQVLLQAAIADRHASLREEGLKEADLEAAMQKWLDGVRESVQVSFENEAFFSGNPEEAGTVDLDTVVVKLNGQSVTAGEIRSAVAGASPQVRENFRKDAKQFVGEYGLMLRLIEYARERQLESKSPYKEQLAWVRMNILSQARLNQATNSVTVTRQDERDYYDAHLDDYTKAKVKVLYVSFGSGDSVGKEFAGKKVLSEEEAKAKIDSIRVQAAGDADFAALVKEYSDDETSKAKGGDFGSIGKSDKIPEHIKDAVFALKAGEVSEPIRQPNGFYLFRVEETGTLPFDDVRREMKQKVRNAKFEEWFESVRQSMKVTFENEEYFDGAAK